MAYQCPTGPLQTRLYTVPQAIYYNREELKYAIYLIKYAYDFSGSLAYATFSPLGQNNVY